MFSHSFESLRFHGSFNVRGEFFDFSTPKVMGILNLTPDSFYDGGQFLDENKALDRVGQMIDEGADVIDIGATSSRPGATIPSVEEELYRLTDIVSLIRVQFPDAILSLDTVYAEVAKKMVLECGVDIINDISAGEIDNTMFATIAELHVPYIMMHMKGIPSTMQAEPFYENLLLEIFTYFSSKVARLRALGVNDIMIDPGFGFGKSVDHNFELLRKVEDFKVLELPILAGLSRKSLIYKTLGVAIEESLNGTSALHMAALISGVNMLRVHDVKEAKECITLYKLLEHK